MDGYLCGNGSVCFLPQQQAADLSLFSVVKALDHSEFPADHSVVENGKADTTKQLKKEIQEFVQNYLQLREVEKSINHLIDGTRCLCFVETISTVLRRIIIEH